METSDEKYLRAVNMLKAKNDELGRVPVRGDFLPEEVSFIKAKLGPWPRALEAAGLKAAVGETAAQKSRKKRAKAKKKLRAQKKEM